MRSLGKPPLPKFKKPTGESEELQLTGVEIQEQQSPWKPVQGRKT